MIISFVSIVALVGVGIGAMVLNNSSRCIEPAFQASSAFGTLPRRFYEIKYEGSEGSIIPQFTFWCRW